MVDVIAIIYLAWACMPTFLTATLFLSTRWQHQHLPMLPLLSFKAFSLEIRVLFKRIILLSKCIIVLYIAYINLLQFDLVNFYYLVSIQRSHIDNNLHFVMPVLCTEDTFVLLSYLISKLVNSFN